MQQAKHTVEPAAYGRDTYLLAGQGKNGRVQAPSGYAQWNLLDVSPARNAARLLWHRFIESPCQDSSRSLTALVAALPPLRNVRAKRLAQRLEHGAARLEVQCVNISPREHECLQWAAEGKTAWETGMILSIAEGSVVKILASAIRKLDCANKPQAVVKALRLGLIH